MGNLVPLGYYYSLCIVSSLYSFLGRKEVITYPGDTDTQSLCVCNVKGSPVEMCCCLQQHLPLMCSASNIFYFILVQDACCMMMWLSPRPR